MLNDKIHFWINLNNLVEHKTYVLSKFLLFFLRKCQEEFYNYIYYQASQFHNWFLCIFL